MAYLILYVLIGLVLLVFIAFFFKFFSLWFRALLSGAHISMVRMIGMWIRRVKMKVIVDSRIMVTKAGMDLDSDQLETHYLAGGDVIRVSKALAAAFWKVRGIEALLAATRALLTRITSPPAR